MIRLSPMSLRSLLLLITSFVFISNCSNKIVGGSYQENLEKLDKVYGYCDNPQRAMNKSTQAYKICKDKEMAAGADGLTDEEFRLPFADGLFNSNNNGKIEYVSSVNKYLWSASLNVLSAYPLKNVDSSGGYLETEWITENNLTAEQRCIIKIQINSTELISTGLDVNIICQNKINEEWQNSNDDFSNEEKQILLATLSAAQNYYSADQNTK